ncbi:MAG: hypothetical protein ACYC1D_03215 [Acidimicrobiales bacterium]
MTRLHLAKKHLAAAAAAGVIILGGGTAAAVAATSPTPSPSAKASPSAKPSTHAHSHHPAAAHRALGLLARSEHTTLELKRKGQWVTLTIDHGIISAVSPTSLTLAHPDGTTATLALNAATKVRGDATSVSGLKDGQRVIVTSLGGAATHVAQHQVKAAQHQVKAKSAAPTAG